MNRKRLAVSLTILLSIGVWAGIKLDVKTHMLEKAEMVGIKHGGVYYLEKEGYEVVETGEDYCLWIEPVFEKKIGAKRYEVRIRLRLTRPALFRERPPLVEREVLFSYDFEPKVLTTDDSFWKFLKEKVKGIRAQEMLRSFYGGQAVAREVRSMLAQRQQ